MNFSVARMVEVKCENERMTFCKVNKGCDFHLVLGENLVLEVRNGLA